LQGKRAQSDSGGAPGRKGKSAKAQSGQWVAYPTERGFDFLFGYVRHKDGHFHYPVEDQREVWENDREVSAGMDLCYTTDLFTARAKKWIADQHEAKPDQPFFVYLAFDTPHAVLRNPPCAYPAGGGLKGGVQWVGRPGEMINTARGEKDAFMHPDYVSATWDDDNDAATPQVSWPDVQKRYANDVRRIDDCVGDLRQLLVDLKIDDDTLVIFTSDNGPQATTWMPVVKFFQSAGPFRGTKYTLYEGGIRVPFVARWPGKIKAGTTNDDAALMFEDVLPTFAELAGAQPQAAVDGISFTSALLTGKQDKPHEFLYWEHYKGAGDGDDAMTQAVRAGDWKIVQRKPGEPFELYDLAKDVAERTDVAKDHPEVVERLKAIAQAQHTPPRHDPGGGKPVGIGDFVR
jgi:arylsulfatase A-like enzyme